MADRRIRPDCRGDGEGVSHHTEIDATAVCDGRAASDRARDQHSVSEWLDGGTLLPVCVSTVCLLRAAGFHPNDLQQPWRGRNRYSDAVSFPHADSNGVAGEESAAWITFCPGGISCGSSGCASTG